MSDEVCELCGSPAELEFLRYFFLCPKHVELFGIRDLSDADLGRFTFAALLDILKNHLIEEPEKMKKLVLDKIEAQKIRDKTIDSSRSFENEWIEVDSVNRVFSVGWKTTDASEIRSVEVIEDGDTLTTSGVSGAVVGGIIAGIGGAALGALLTRKTGQVVYSLKIRIYYHDGCFDDLDFIQYKTKKDSIDYRTAKRYLEETWEKLNYIMPNEKSMAAIAEDAQERAERRNRLQSQKDKLIAILDSWDYETADPFVVVYKEYKELRYRNFLSQNEFNNNLTRLLNSDLARVSLVSYCR